MLPLVPCIPPHGGIDEPHVRAVQAIQHRLDIHVVQRKMQDFPLAVGLLVGHIAYLHARVLVLLAGIAAAGHIAVCHDQCVIALPLPGADDQHLVVYQQLCHQLVQKRRGVLVHVRFYVPEIVFALSNFLPFPECPELTTPDGVGDHVRADPEAGVPQLEFLRRCQKIAARDLHRSGRTSLASGEPLPKIKCHCPPPIAGSRRWAAVSPARRCQAPPPRS